MDRGNDIINRLDEILYLLRVSTVASLVLIFPCNDNYTLFRDFILKITNDSNAKNNERN